MHSNVAAAAGGRKRSWTAPNGQTVVLPVDVTAWEDDPVTGERTWVVTATVALIDKTPTTVRIVVEAEDGLQVDRLQREFRWQTPADIVRVWMPDVLHAGGDPYVEEPPAEWWALEGKYELTDVFLEEIAEEYLRQGRGYARPMSIKYRTSERTVRSWIDKARERGILGASVGRGRVGAQ